MPKWSISTSGECPARDFPREAMQHHMGLKCFQMFNEVYRLIVHLYLRRYELGKKWDDHHFSVVGQVHAAKQLVHEGWSPYSLCHVLVLANKVAQLITYPSALFIFRWYLSSILWLPLHSVRLSLAPSPNSVFLCFSALFSCWKASASEVIFFMSSPIFVTLPSMFADVASYSRIAQSASWLAHKRHTDVARSKRILIS